MSQSDIEGLDFDPDDMQSIMRAAEVERAERLNAAICRVLEQHGMYMDFHPLYRGEFAEERARAFLAGYVTARQDNGTFATHLGYNDPAESGKPIDFTNPAT